MRPVPHHAREVLWQHADGIGLEFVRVSESASVVQADGTILTVRDGAPLRVRYAINCAPDWTVQAVVVSVVGGGLADLLEPEAPWIRNAAGGFACSLKHDGAGGWSNTVGGAALPALEGCTLVGLAGSVFTCTLAIRAASSRGIDEVCVVQVTGPRESPRGVELHIMPLAREGAWRLGPRAPADIACGDITVDAEGIVLDVPGVAQRLGG